MNKSPLGTSETGDPLPLASGPLTTSKAVKGVTMHDRGSRDAAFLEIDATVLYRLPEIVTFYDKLKDRGYAIYPGSFRMGCIGRIAPDHMRGFLAATAEVLAGMKVGPLKSAA